MSHIVIYAEEKEEKKTKQIESSFDKNKMMINYY